MNLVVLRVVCVVRGTICICDDEGVTGFGNFRFLRLGAPFEFRKKAWIPQHARPQPHCGARGGVALAEMARCGVTNRRWLRHTMPWQAGRTVAWQTRRPAENPLSQLFSNFWWPILLIGSLLCRDFFCQSGKTVLLIASCNLGVSDLIHRRFC